MYMHQEELYLMGQPLLAEVSNKCRMNFCTAAALVGCCFIILAGTELLTCTCIISRGSSTSDITIL
jgi:hypothetical protein